MSDLLGDLRAAGEVDSEGFFTLDQRKAQEKMREFQLVDAHEYVLKLVQAAVAGGATRIAVTADAQGVTLQAEGWELSREMIEQPFAGLFLSQERSDGEFYRHLSIAINAALALHPKHVHLRSAGCLMPIEDRPGAVRPDPLRGATRVEVAERVSWRLAGRAVRSLVGGVPEAQLLRARAAWCPIPVELNGKALTAEDWRRTAQQRLADRRCEWHEGGGTRAAVWLPDAPAEKAVVAFVKHGVQVCERSLDLPPLQPRAVIHADLLLTNASDSDVVEDARFKDALGELGKAADALLTRLCAEYQAGAGGERRRLRPWLLRAAGHRFKGGVPKGAAHPLLHVPLFEDMNGAPASIAELAAALEKDNAIYYHEGALDFPLPIGPSILRLDDPEQRAALRQVAGDRLKPIARESRLLKRAINMDRWSKSSTQRRLPTRDAYLEVAPFHEEGWQGELGVRRHDGKREKALIAFHVDGRHVVTKEVGSTGLHFDAWIDSKELTPSFTYDDVTSDAAYKAALAYLFRRFQQACERMVRVTGPDHPLADEVRAHLVDLLQSLHQRKAFPTALEPAIEAFPLFPTLSGRLASIDDLRRDKKEFGSIHLVRGVSPGPQMDHRQIVLDTEAEPRLSPVLKAFLGSVTDYRKRLEAERTALANMARPSEAATLAGKALLATDFAVDGVRGSVGLALPGQEPAIPVISRRKAREVEGVERPATVRFLKDGKPLQTRTVLLEFGPVEAVVDSPRLTPSPTWDAVVEDAAFDEALDAVRAGARELTRRAALELPRLKDWGRLAVLRLLLDYVAYRPAELPGEVAEADIFPALDGTPVSLRRLRAEVDAHGSFLYVPAQPPARGDGGERPVIVMDVEATARALRAVFNSAQMSDHSDAIARQAARRSFLAQREEPAVLPGPASRYVVVHPVTWKWHGEVALLSPSLPFEGTSIVRVMREGRTLDTLNLVTPVAAEAVLAWDEAPANRSWSGLGSEPAKEEVRLAVRDALEAAVAGVLDADPAPGSPESLVLLRWVIASVSSLKDLERSRDLEGRIHFAPLLTDSTGERWSLAELGAQYRKLKRVPWVPPELEGRPLDERRILRCDDGTLRLLQRLFRTVVSDVDALRDEEQARHNRERAPLVKSLELPRGTWLARVEASGGGLQGELAVEAGGGGVDLVCDGRRVERGKLFGELPVAGVLTSASFTPSRTWDEVLMKAHHERALDSLLDALYVQVAARAAGGDDTARRALLDYYVHRRNRLVIAGEKVASDLWVPVLPLADGSRARLDEVIGDWRKAGHVAVGRSGAVISSRDDAAIRFLRRFFGEAAVREVEPSPPTPARPEPGLLKDLKSAAQASLGAIDDVVRSAEKVAADTLRDVVAATGEQQRRERLEAARRERERRAQEEEAQRRRAREASKQMFEAPREPTPEEKRRAGLMQALRACLKGMQWRMSARWQEQVFGTVLVQPLGLGPLVTAEKHRLVLNVDHPVAKAALERYETDRGIVACLASALYTAVNQAQEEVRDEDELRFLEDLADWVLGL